MDIRRNPPASWHAWIRFRADRVNKDAKAIAHEIPSKMKSLDPDADPEVLDPALVEQWMSGERAPATPAIHRALMHVLRLPHTLSRGSKAADSGVRDIRRGLTGLDFSLAGDRMDIENFYAEIPAEKKTSELAPLSQAGKDLPRRKMTLGNSGLKGQPASELRRIMKTTDSPGQYLEAFLALHDFSQDEFGERVTGSASGHGMIGDHIKEATLPDRHTLRQMQSTMDDDYDDYEALVIAKRLKKIAKAVEARGLYTQDAVGNQLSSLPSSFWAIAVDVTNHPKAWEARDAADKPRWFDYLIPLSDKGFYLRALRNASDLTAEEVGTALGLGKTSITDAESNKYPFTATTKKIITFYESGQAAQCAARKPNHLPLPRWCPAPQFMQSVYEALPPMEVSKTAGNLAEGAETVRVYNGLPTITSAGAAPETQVIVPVAHRQMTRENDAGRPAGS